jgi:hypothetical protein
MRNLLLLFIMFAGITLSVNSQTIDDPFFDKVSYIGAFGTDGDWTEGWTEWDPVNEAYAAPTVTKGNGVFTQAGGTKITADETWSGVLTLDGWVYVENGATLTIAPGTIIRGTNKSALIITPGSKINAAGTKTSPIVFTSSNGAGLRGPSNWGGIVLCGNGVLNTAGGTKITEGGVGVTYGGTNNADNSGVLQYVRIEFSGYEVATGSELNGLSLCGVGSGTTLDHIQVSYAGDDGYEWWGGASKARYLISYKTEDDDFDTDNGFSGMVQFGLILRDNSIVDTDAANGFESDNDDTGTDNTPYTNAIFSNISAFGPAKSATDPATLAGKHAEGFGIKIRRASRLRIYNSIFAGFGGGLRLETNSGWTAAQTDLLTVQYTKMAGMRGSMFAASSITGVTATEVESWYRASARKNTTHANATDLMITDPFNATAPNFKPTLSSPVLNASYWYSPSTATPKVNGIQYNVLRSYPNPFSGVAYIDVPVDVRSEVSAVVYDLTGRAVKEIYRGIMNPGLETIEFNAQDLPRGIYIAKITAGIKTYTVKMMAK